MASSLPFNERLDTAAIPKLFEIKRSLFDFDTCAFTVINYRDQTTHKVEVQVTRVSEPHHPAPRWKQFRVEGKILRIDGNKWGPPVDQFDAQYVEDTAEHSNFQLIGPA